MKHKGFTLIELMVVMIILSILVALGTGSFISSQKRSRDSKRKNDLRQIALSLEAYYNDFGRYPQSSGDGDVQGCGTDAAETCIWGAIWRNDSTIPETIYMTLMPADPLDKYRYYYRSDSAGSYYILYAYIENDKDEGDGVVIDGYTSTGCGSVACRYAIASSNVTP